MNKKNILGIVIFIVLIFVGLIVSNEIFDIVDFQNDNKNKETVVLTPEEELEQYLKATMSEKVKSYSAIVKETKVYNNYTEEDVTEYMYDGVNYTIKMVETESSDYFGEIEKYTYTNYITKKGTEIINYRNDYDSETKAWYKESEHLLVDDEDFISEYFQNGIDLSDFEDFKSAVKCKVTDVEGTIKFDVSYDMQTFKDNSEGLYDVTGDRVGSIYVKDGYVVKIVMDDTKIHVTEDSKTRTFIMEISNINSTNISVPEDVVNTAKDIPNEE